MLTLDSGIRSPHFGLDYSGRPNSRPLRQILDKRLWSRTPRENLVRVSEAMFIPTTTEMTMLAGLHYAGMSDDGVARLLTGHARASALPGTAVGDDDPIDIDTAVDAAFTRCHQFGIIHCDTVLRVKGFRSGKGLGWVCCCTHDGGLSLVWRGPQGRYGHQEIRSADVASDRLSLRAISRAVSATSDAVRL